MPNRLFPLTALLAATLGASAYTFGGWAVITVDDLPEYVTVGQPVKISFTVRQHGVTLLDDLSPTVTATDPHTKSTIHGTTPVAVSSGRYSTNLIVPRTGAWTITINSGFRSSQVTLLPLPAVAPGTAMPAPAPAQERGQRLFVAKGCLTCHALDGVAGSGQVAVGPNLTPKRYQAEYLARFLADPSIARTPGAQMVMPNLGLKPAEITALVALINSERRMAEVGR